MARSRWIVGISVAVALILLIPTLVLANGDPPSAGRDRARRTYKGKTSQNQQVFIQTVKNDGNWGIEEMDYSFKMRCDDGSKFGAGIGLSFGRPIWLDSRDRFAFDENFGDFALHVHGRLGPNAGSGTAEFNVAELTQDEQAQLCTSKERTWTVERTRSSTPTPVPVPGQPVGASTARHTIHVTVGADGKVHVTSS